MPTVQEARPRSRDDAETRCGQAYLRMVEEAERRAAYQRDPIGTLAAIDGEDGLLAYFFSVSMPDRSLTHQQNLPQV